MQQAQQARELALREVDEVRSSMQQREEELLAENAELAGNLASAQKVWHASFLSRSSIAQ